MFRSDPAWSQVIRLSRRCLNFQRITLYGQTLRHVQLALRLQNLQPVLTTPLPQRSIDSVGFERIPELENAFALQQILEVRVSPLPSEESFNLVVTLRQLLCDKLEGETSSKTKLVLMRYRKVAIRSFKVFRNLLVEDVVEIRSPIDFARSSCLTATMPVPPWVAS